MNEFVLFCIRAVSWFLRLLPTKMALGLARGLGWMVYYFDAKHRARCYANLKQAFGHEFTASELESITRRLFINFAQNIMELLRLPSLNKAYLNKYIQIEMSEATKDLMRNQQGVIGMAVHFGSWELIPIIYHQLGFANRIIVKEQTRFAPINQLLNEFRGLSGASVIQLGLGLRDFIKCVKNKNNTGVLVDQGGKEGELVPFFGRDASFASAPFRMASKYQSHLLVTKLVRRQGPYQKLTVADSLPLIKTDDLDQDVQTNLRRYVVMMEDQIRQHPDHHNWFYKIWKYSRQQRIVILSDAKLGHEKQSLLAADVLRQQLESCGHNVTVEVIQVNFKSQRSLRRMIVDYFLSNKTFLDRRHQILKRHLSEDSYHNIAKRKAEYTVSCGTHMAYVHELVQRDWLSKSVVLQSPGLLRFKKFNAVFLPYHDWPKQRLRPANVYLTEATPTLVAPDFIKEKAQELTKQLPKLGALNGPVFALFIGGDSQHVYLNKKKLEKALIQLKHMVSELNGRWLVTASRRTPMAVIALINSLFSDDQATALLITDKFEKTPAAVGGMFGLADYCVVTGDSIAMISEAAASGRPTLILRPQSRKSLEPARVKHLRCIDRLESSGYIFSSSMTDAGQNMMKVVKRMVPTKPLDDRTAMAKSLRMLV